MSRAQKGTNDFLSKADLFFANRWKIILGICCFFTLIFGMFLFDAKMSVGGDDSSYIMRAMNFLREGKFPSFQGALYPLFLSIFVGIFGINVMLLKWISFLFTFGWIYLLYKTFKNRLPASVLGFSLLICSINSYVLYYASQTYNEAFFLFVEMSFVYYFLNRFDAITNNLDNEKASYKSWALVGFLVFLVTITKNIGLAILIGTVFFLIWNKRWFSTIYYAGSYAIFAGLYNVLKRLLFSNTSTQISNQGSMLLYKDPYNKSKGKEEIAGFIDRFIQNSHLYISKHYAKMLGFRDFKAITTLEWLTYLVVLIFVLFMAIAIKRKNKMLFFLGIYNAAVLSVTFIVLQTRWDQDRLIMLIFPFLTVFFFYGLYEVFKSSKLKKLQIVALFFMGFTFFTVASVTWGKSKKNITVFKRNLAGDKFYGYSPDWQNYLQMCEWAGKNLPVSSKVMVRKPSMAAIFGEINIFHGLYRLPLTKEENPKVNADTLVKYMESKKITHVIMARLRKNSNVNNGLTINTVQRALSLYASKKPTGLKIIHRIGQAESSYLFELVEGKNNTPQESIDALKANLIINPKNPNISFMLGNAQMNSRQFADAAISYTKAINNSKKKTFEGFYNRGLAYINSSQFDKAIPDFLKSLEEKPNYGASYYNLGIAYLNKGDKKNAKKALQQAERLKMSIPPEISAQLN